MLVGLLYQKRDHSLSGGYHYQDTLCKDLNLSFILEEMSNEDPYIYRAAHCVMMLPLSNTSAIEYRQKAILDAVSNRENIKELYNQVSEAFIKIERHKEQLKKEYKIGNVKPESMQLRNSLEILKILIDNISKIKDIVNKGNARYRSDAFSRFRDRLITEYSAQMIIDIDKSINDMSFLLNNSSIIMSASIGKGLRSRDFIINALEDQAKPSSIKFIEKLKTTYTKLFQKNIILLNQAELLQDSYLFQKAGLIQVLKMYNNFIDEMTGFFEQLRFQLAFYVGCMNLYYKLKHLKMPFCMPSSQKNTEGDGFKFKGLYDLSMALMTMQNLVTNDLEFEDNHLFIISGANQGGKSTFLRSIGIAQVMMQCGMFVPAEEFSNNLFDNIFTHFTRREDQLMNSGRLDEELSRMKLIINAITRKSLLLMNESFSSTTEKEGSMIMWDIVRALYESKISVIMVTHLYEFVKTLYERKLKHVQFLSAERKNNGERTYKIIASEPTYTSFGIDLYKEIIGN
ncbi:MAG: hypothetical protein GX288_09050 [Clostridiales bacterium]|nr:hypothetical protein [Clostridiales bacterium]